MVGVDGTKWARCRFGPEVRKQVEDVRYYISPPFGPIPDREELVRFVAPPGVVARMLNEYKLQRIEDGKEREAPDLRRFWKRAPYWWKPSQSSNFIYYWFPSSSFILAYDERNHVVYWKH